MIGLAHALGLGVTAEGVETPSQADQLRALGSDTGQGWLFARPSPPESINDLLRGGTPSGELQLSAGLRSISIGGLEAATELSVR